MHSTIKVTYVCTHQIESMSNLENTQQQMRKGVLEFCILGIISQGEVYPSDIINKLIHFADNENINIYTAIRNKSRLPNVWEE